ncbi:MAG: type II toxin-antitoxin system VapC family toxin [Bacteroidota bacterium]
MEEKELIICDTDVLIEVLDRNNPTLQNELLKIGFKSLAISAITAGELLVGSRNKKHSKKIEHFLNELIVIPLTGEVSATFLNLISKYSLSHGLRVQDARIAATALVYDFPLFTFNKRDFKFVKGIRLH